MRSSTGSLLYRLTSSHALVLQLRLSTWTVLETSGGTQVADLPLDRASSRVAQPAAALPCTCM